ALPLESMHATAGEPFFIPSAAANGAGGLEFLRIMLSKEQAENFSALTSSPTVVRDTVPEDAFGSTALATANEMIDAAGEDIFHYNYRDWYGLGPDTVTLWTEFLNGDLTADEAREREQDLIDAVREDDSIEKFDVESWLPLPPSPPRMRLGAAEGADVGSPLRVPCSSRCSWVLPSCCTSCSW